MLSDHERRALLELQRQLLAEDPDFARSFDEVGQRDSAFSLQWVDAMPRWVPTAAVVGTVALGVLMLAWAWFSRTRVFNALRAAGSNERSAFLNRVSLTATNAWAYGLSGFFAAAAGGYFAAQTGAGSPTGPS